MTRTITERGDDLRVAVAREVMGWKQFSPGKFNQYGAWVDYLSPNVECMGWFPGSCREDACSVEDRIEELGIELSYVSMLRQVVNSESCWAIRRATPEQVCIAALAAVREVR
jgi:hypothetical protein